MITIYDGGATDFSTLGLGVLLPKSCDVNWEAGGMFDLSLTHPIDDRGRWTLLERGRIIKAPSPEREAPVSNPTGGTQSITRQIYKVTTSKGDRLRMRAKPSMSAEIIASYKPNTEVIRLEVNGDWARVIIVKGGKTGWMWNANLTFVRTQTETVVGDKPGSVIEVKQLGDQLFRIGEVERDGTNLIVSVSAMHISYDLRRVSVKGIYSPKNVPVATVVSELMARALSPHRFTIHCFVTGNITADYGGKSILECLLDPESGIVAQTKARIIRDNFDIYLIPDAVRDMGVHLRYRKNLLGVKMLVDDNDVVTRIEPVGKTKDGDPLFLESNGYVDSPIIGNYPDVYSRRVEYDVQVGKDGIETAAQARTRLTELANADFESGIDLPAATLDVQYLNLGDTREYAQYKDLQAVNPYDTVHVIHGPTGINASVRLTKCTMDGLLARYKATTFGDLLTVKPTVYGYDIARGSVIGSKLGYAAVDTQHMRDMIVTYAKMTSAAIEQLSADSITAIRAHINELVAGNIAADELFANIAAIAIAQITTANIDHANINWADIETLTAEIAQIANVEIGTADIDWAHIKDLVTGTAIIHEGVGGKLFIDRLAVNEANMVNLTVGELIVRGYGGAYYQFSVDENGHVTATQVQIDNGDIVDRTINAGEKLVLGSVTAGELNVTDIFANSATIRNLIAANLDVDTLFARVGVVNTLKTTVISNISYGGNNVLKNSAFEFDRDDWGYLDVNPVGTNKSMIVTLKSDQSDWDPWDANTCKFRATNETGIYGIYQLVSGLRKNTRYTFSGYVRQDRMTGKVIVDVSDSVAYTLRVRDTLGAPTGTDYKNLAGYQRFWYTFDTGDASDFRVAVWGQDFGTDGVIWVTRFQLEQGDVATEWSPNRNEISAGSAILMSERGVVINAPKLTINVPGENGDTTIDENGIAAPRIVSPSIQPRYTGPATITVKKDATDAQVAAGNYARSIGDALAKVEQKTLAYAVTISITLDTYYETYTVYSITGGHNLNINGNGATLVGRLNFYGCVISLWYDALHVKQSVLTDHGLYFRNCRCVLISNAIFTAMTGASASYSALMFEHATIADVRNSEFYGAWRSIRANYGCLVTSRNNKGNSRMSVLGAILIAEGTQPCDVTTFGIARNETGVLLQPGTVTVDQGAATPPVPPTATQTFAATDSHTVYGSSMWPGSWKSETQEVWQGYSSITKYQAAEFWFRGLSVLAGKTILAASLTIKRLSGAGKGDDIRIDGYYGDRAYNAGSGSPNSRVSMGTLGKMGQTDITPFAIPAAAVAYLAANANNRCIALNPGDTAVMSGKDYSSNYGKFSGVGGQYTPQLTVTYQP